MIDTTGQLERVEASFRRSGAAAVGRNDTSIAAFNEVVFWSREKMYGDSAELDLHAIVRLSHSGR